MVWVFVLVGSRRGVEPCVVVAVVVVITVVVVAAGVVVAVAVAVVDGVDAVVDAFGHGGADVCSVSECVAGVVVLDAAGAFAADVEVVAMVVVVVVVVVALDVVCVAVVVVLGV